MKYLICEQNFVGFLTAVYDSFYSVKDGDAISSDFSICTLEDTFAQIKEDVEKAKKVRAGIIKKGGAAFFDVICDAYRSCNPQKENIIFKYLKLYFKFGKITEQFFDNADVIEFNDLTNKVWHELHRIPAFIRLQEMSNGIFYGFYSSDNDLIEKVIKKLIPQFNTMKFIIHDFKRRKMAYYDGETVHYSVAPEKIEIELSESEVFFQSLWKQYHENVSIKERANPRLQRAFAPKKYRHFMLEF